MRFGATSQETEVSAFYAMTFSSSIRKEKYDKPSRADYLFQVARIANSIVRVAQPDILEALFQAGHITLQARNAGQRLRSDYYQARLGSRVTASYNPVSTPYSPYSESHERTEEEEAAYKRWRAAVMAMKYPLSDIVVTALCLETPVSEKILPLILTGLNHLVKWYECVAVETMSIA